jgi:hypothetical protein
MSSRLRPQQLEARVIDLVDLVLAGGRIEDDLVECKSQWPDPQQRSSTRQLAGHANKAHDEPILWIIGIDEKTHTLTQPSPVEVADWWAAMSSRFDPPGPELEHHLVVHVGERQAVTALRFGTDRSPYVIICGGEDGALEREVPIRDGTRTRSARRDELLRLLIPAVTLPSAQLLSASLQASHLPEVEGKTQSRTNLNLSAAVFFQQSVMSNGVVMLPAHLMHSRIDSAGFGSLRCELRYMPASFANTTNRPVVIATSLHGVDRRDDGVVITGPGILHVDAFHVLDGDVRPTLVAAGAIRIHLSFGVAGADRRIQLDANLDHAPDETNARREMWNLNLPTDDPWG